MSTEGFFMVGIFLLAAAGAVGGLAWIEGETAQRLDHAITFRDPDDTATVLVQAAIERAIASRAAFVMLMRLFGGGAFLALWGALSRIVWPG